jgi:adenylyltransferase/sulfurtransferase
MKDLSDEELQRYSRQLLLPQLDYAGQQKLSGSRVLVVGLGGLGSPVALYLAAAGVGELVLCDHDEVELSNLQRQVIHDGKSVGRNKAESASYRISRLNPECGTEVYNRKLIQPELQNLLKSVDVVVDCSDNFETRYMLNQLCVSAQVPLVSGAAIRLEGQLMVVDATKKSACYRCVYGDVPEDGQTCNEQGVLGPVVGVMGSLQALEVIKLLAGLGESLVNRMLIWDASAMEFRKIGLKPDPACPVCGNR